MVGYLFIYYPVQFRYLRINIKEVIGAIIDSSEARMKAVSSHPPPKSRDDVADLISDTSGTEFQVFQNKPDTVIKTIAAGNFRYKSNVRLIIKT